MIACDVGLLHSTPRFSFGIPLRLRELASDLQLRRRCVQQATGLPGIKLEIEEPRLFGIGSAKSSPTS